MKIDETFTDRDFSALPLIVEGESKIVRDAGDGKVVIKFKPTIYSFTSNRCGVVYGSDVLRLRATKILVDVLKIADIHHAYQEVNDRFVLADKIENPPPIEVIVKQFHSGTSKHRYYGMNNTQVRKSNPLYYEMKIQNEQAYPKLIVRFDWRNPFQDANGNKLADEILCEDMADWYIDVKEAKKTALRTYSALSDFLASKDIVCYDLCLFITADGKCVFGELSQDCGRFRHFDLGSLDKDVWRSGGSSEKVLEKWKLFLDLIGG